jgi:alkanal monooxygenase alpha chain
MTMKWGIFLTTANPPDTTHTQVFRDTMKLCNEAERLGYDGVWLLEHHFTRYGLCGSPLTMAGYILGHSKRLKVGTAVSVIPLEHPVRLAENVALLDQLSEGRLRFGVGRGFFLKDFEVFGADVKRNHEALSQWVDIMVRAWTTGRTSADSGLIKFPEVPVYPEPFTKPTPPLYVACSSPSRTEWAAERGLPMMIDYLTEDEEKIAQLELYNEVSVAAGHDPSMADHMLSCIAFVGPPNLADRIRKYLVWWEHEFLHASRLFDPQYEAVENYGFYRRQREAAIIRGDWTPEHRCERILRMSPAGEPAECRERLQRTVELTGLKHIVLGFEALGSVELACESMQRFSEEVAPFVTVKKTKEPRPSGVLQATAP